ncbi:aminoacyl-tRNA hydrolase [Bartonella sp. HY406]|uniref:aminoacyl-tRNA hydrolase n=1 Tax=Bartonella sp. HY406 TaxID=2979331 RepID=UPI0021C9D344|nr:aminoacyl-tRNA hydrolase [Bartonella sp. HY406]UXN03993.1 aminoacyl-tRNA hydrolase [Bartonella sp. HY406]
MLLIAGLGNPGAQYAHNRHNIGFMAVDDIQQRHNFSSWSKKFHALISEGKINDRRILLIKPQTYMNLSGQSVGEAMRFYKVPLENLIVIHDELDLPAGKVRIKTGGGSGGHNGIKSIDAHCGANYRRLRLGIGHPGQKELVHNHVLGDFAKVDNDWLEQLLKNISDNIGEIADNKDSQFMNKISGQQDNNAKTKKPKVDKAKTDEGATGKPKQQSHIRQARDDHHVQKASGPMADMLKRLFGNKEK